MNHDPDIVLDHNPKQSRIARRASLGVAVTLALFVTVEGLACAKTPAQVAPDVEPSPAPAATHSKAIPAEEKKILGVLEDLDRNQREGMMNVPVEDGKLLRVLTESMGAKRVVEIGTSNGYSGLWFCMGLRGSGGTLTTYEMDADRAALARANFKRAGVDSMVTLVEGDAHEGIKQLKGPIDLVFIDADKDGYMDYLEKLLPLVRPGGLIVAHNTNMEAAGIRTYIHNVTHHSDLETIFLNTHLRGVGVSLKKR